MNVYTTTPIRKGVVIYLKGGFVPKKGEKTGYTISCDYCGKLFYVTKTRYNRSNHHFCSGACQHRFLHDEVYVDRACEICGTVMHLRKVSSQRFCSIKCQSEWQKSRTGKDNPKFTSLLVHCDWCNKDFYTRPCKLKNQDHHFCSTTCRQDWYAHIWSQRDEWRDISRQRAVDILQSNLSRKTTRPQQIINQCLTRNGIEYINEYDCKYYAIDNYLSCSGLMIEVMGDFWHSNPTTYALNELNSIQSKRIGKDKAKHTYIKNVYNVEILYLWEYDILNRLDLCELLIQKYIESEGRLSNYHSYNYDIHNGQLMLHKEILIPYFDQDIKTQSVVNA